MEGQVNLTTLMYNVVRDDSLAHLICDRGGPLTSTAQVLDTFYNTAIPTADRGIRPLVLHGLLYMSEGWIIWSEWDKAITATRTRAYKDAERSIDKAYALWYGHGTQGRCANGMYRIADACAFQMSTQFHGRALTNQLMSNAHNDALDAIGRRNSTGVFVAALSMLQVYVEVGLQFLLRNAYSIEILGPSCQSQRMVDLARVFSADPDLTGPLCTAALALGASSTNIDAYLAYSRSQVITYAGMQAVTRPIVADIGRFTMNDLGSPNPFAAKQIWFLWTGVDVRNCTAV